MSRPPNHRSGNALENRIVSFPKICYFWFHQNVGNHTDTDEFGAVGKGVVFGANSSSSAAGKPNNKRLSRGGGRPLKPESELTPDQLKRRKRYLATKEKARNAKTT